MRDFLVLAVHLIVTLAKLLRPGGAKAVAPNRWRLNSN
jgi:hypothetical protein